MGTDAATGIFEFDESTTVGATFAGYLNKGFTPVKNAIAARPRKEVFTRPSSFAIASISATPSTELKLTTVLVAAGQTAYIGAAGGAQDGWVVVGTAGVYEVEIVVPFAGNATGVRYVDLKVNGTVVAEHSQPSGSGTTRTTLFLRKTLALTAQAGLAIGVGQNAVANLAVSNVELAIRRML